MLWIKRGLNRKKRLLWSCIKKIACVGTDMVFLKPLCNKEIKNQKKIGRVGGRKLLFWLFFFLSFFSSLYFPFLFSPLLHGSCSFLLSGSTRPCARSVRRLSLSGKRQLLDGATPPSRAPPRRRPRLLLELLLDGAGQWGRWVALAADQQGLRRSLPCSSSAASSLPHTCATHRTRICSPLDGGLSIGTNFPPSLWFRRVLRLGFVRVSFGPRSARLRLDFAWGRRIYVWYVHFQSDCLDFECQLYMIFLVGGCGPRDSFGAEVSDSYSKIW